MEREGLQPPADLTYTRTEYLSRLPCFTPYAYYLLTPGACFQNPGPDVRQDCTARSLSCWALDRGYERFCYPAAPAEVKNAGPARDETYSSVVGLPRCSGAPPTLTPSPLLPLSPHARPSPSPAERSVCHRRSRPLLCSVHAARGLFASPSPPPASLGSL